MREGDKQKRIGRRMTYYTNKSAVNARAEMFLCQFVSVIYWRRVGGEYIIEILGLTI